MNKADREYYKRLAAVQKEYTPEKWDTRKPYNWKKEWGPFVKYDSDWYAEGIVKLLLYKLEKTYIGMDVYSDEYREDLDKKLKTLRETIDLGKKILNYEYDKDYYQWSKLHCAHVILIHKRGKVLKGEFLHKLVFSDAAEEDGRDPLERYFREKEVNQWAEENGYKRQELAVTYSGEWDSKENQKIYRKMVKEAIRAQQKDRDCFFKLISHNYFYWGW